jgi:hypothetical protein
MAAAFLTVQHQNDPIINLGDEIYRHKMQQTALWCTYVFSKTLSFFTPYAPVVTAYQKAQLVLGRFCYPAVVLTGAIYLFQIFSCYITSKIDRNAGLSLAMNRHRIEVLNKVYDRLKEQSSYTPSYNPFSRLNPYQVKPLYLNRSAIRKIECDVERESAEAAFNRLKEHHEPPRDPDNKTAGYFDNEKAVRIYKRSIYRIVAHQLGPCMLKVLYNQMIESKTFSVDSPLPLKVDQKGWDEKLQDQDANGIFFVDVPFNEHQIIKDRPFICVATGQGEKKLMDFNGFENLVQQHKQGNFEDLQTSFNQFFT